MSERLIYVMGPSGAGKDSVLAWLRQQLPPQLPLHWAQRSITRSAQAGGEAHEALDTAPFLAVRAAHGFALSWQAHGLHYGIRHAQLHSLAQGGWVLVNGSRGHLAEALQQFPAMVLVHITADAATLTRRLLARGREPPSEVAQRVLRAQEFAVPPKALQIDNSQQLAHAGAALLKALALLPHWPA